MAEDRPAALRRTGRVLADFAAAGVPTPFGFRRALVRHPGSAAGTHRPDFPDRRLADGAPSGTGPGPLEVAS